MDKFFDMLCERFPTSVLAVTIRMMRLDRMERHKAVDTDTFPGDFQPYTIHPLGEWYRN